MPNQPHVKGKTVILLLGIFFLSGCFLNLKGQSIRQEFDRVNDTLNRCISRAYHYRQSNIDSTIRYTDLAINKALKYKLQLQLAKALTIKAYVLVLQGNYDKAEYCTRIANNIFTQHKSLKGLQYSYRIYGIIYGTIGDYSKALDYNYRSLRISEALNDSAQMVTILSNISIIYYYQENDDKALEMNLRVLNMSKGKVMGDIKGTTLVNIGIIYSEKHDFILAEDYYKKALEFGITNHNLNVQVSALSNLARMYLEKKEYDKSLKTYAEALEVQQKYTMDISLCSIYLGIGDNYRLLGKEDRALKNYEAAIDIALKTGSTEKLKDVYGNIADLKYDKGDFKEAFEYLNKSYALKDSLSSMEVKEKIASIEAKYETEKKDNKIKHLSFIEQAKQEKINLQRRRLIILVALIFISLIMLLVLFYQNRKIKLVYKKLVIKNLELMQKEKDRSEESSQALSQLAVNLAQGSNLLIPAEDNGFDHADEDETDEMTGIATPVSQEDEEKPKYQKSLLTQEQKKDLLSRILDAIENRKLYLDKELSIEWLSEDLGIYRKYISQVINELLGKNFTQLINEYRVREARNLLVSDEYQKYTLEAIGQAVGFHSKSSFNTAFKKFTGITPSFFRETAQTGRNIQEI